MLRYLTILLVLVSFQANVIASVLMTSDRLALSMSAEKHTHAMYNEPEKFQNKHHVKAVGHCSELMEMQSAGACDPVQTANGDCDKHCECGLCSGQYFKAVLAHNFDILPSCQFNFESDYRFSGIPVTHLLNLKPPKNN